MIPAEPVETRSKCFVLGLSNFVVCISVTSHLWSPSCLLNGCLHDACSFGPVQPLRTSTRKHRKPNIRLREACGKYRKASSQNPQRHHPTSEIHPFSSPRYVAHTGPHLPPARACNKLKIMRMRIWMMRMMMMKTIMISAEEEE